jgi:hypothetical protein
MAYDSTALILHSAAIGRAHSTSGYPYGGNVWRYHSADALGTVSGSSYFSNGYTKGMRKYDHVLVVDTGTTAFHQLMVSSVTTSGGATAGTITSSST